MLSLKKLLFPPLLISIKDLTSPKSLLNKSAQEFLFPASALQRSSFLTLRLELLSHWKGQLNN